MTDLSTWRLEFQRLDHCPWPGARPLTERDRPDQLVGRQSDLLSLADALRDHRIVVLHANSGDGKSSLIMRGLLPTLEAEGRSAIRVGRYLTSGGQPEQMMRDFVRDALGARRAEASADPANAAAGTSGLASDPNLRALDEAPPLSAPLIEQLGEATVVVLDQFEEFIRYQTDRVVRDLLGWIAQQVADHPVKFIISLRSEFVHRLRPLREVIRSSFWYTEMSLGPIDHPRDIAKIIMGANKDENAITRPAAQALLERWMDAREAGQDVGPLQLQGTLYTLYHRAVPKSDGDYRVDEDHVSEFARLADDSMHEHSGHVGPASLFAFGLAESVARKLRHCMEAAQTAGVDPLLTQATKVVASHTVEHLYSDTYKLPRDRRDLAGLALRRELSELGFMGRQHQLNESASQVFDDFAAIVDKTSEIDLLTAMPNSVKPSGGAAPPLDAGSRDASAYLAPLGILDVPWVSDPAGRTAGALLGCQPIAALIEELRRFFFALVWLDEAKLVSMVKRQGGGAVLTLVHDGLAEGLESWRNRDVDSAWEALHAFTAFRGETFAWDDGTSSAPSRPDELTGTRELPRTYANVRWRGCIITAEIRHVVFVSSDLRGCEFKGCLLQDVTFVNCLLDDVTFEGCVFEGTGHGEDDQGEGDREPDVRPLQPGETTDDFIPTFPVFSVELPMSESIAEAEAMLVYRRRHGVDRPDQGSIRKPVSLLSLIPGVPAVPITTASHPRLAALVRHMTRNVVPAAEEARWTAQEGAMPFQLSGGGLTMFGGRLNSFVIINCAFRGDARLSLRHIAGTSLELAEQTAGTVDIYDAAIRGLSITSPLPGASEGPTGTDSNTPVTQGTPATLKVTLRESKVLNAWFGPGLAGRVDFDSCVVWQALNANQGSLVATLTSSPHSGVINMSADSPEADFGGQPDGLDDRAFSMLQLAAEQIDYCGQAAELALTKVATAARKRGMLTPDKETRQV